MKVIKVTYTNWRHSREEVTIYEDRRFIVDKIVLEEYAFDKRADIKDTIEDYDRQLTLTLHVAVGDAIFERTYDLTIKGGERKPINIVKEERKTVYDIEVPSGEWKDDVIRAIAKAETLFYFTESELIDQCHNLMKGEYNVVNFKTQVGIGGRIIDGLAITRKSDSHPIKIIGFEAKTDRDNYTRLYDQVSAYLSLCDEVYMVIQKKEVPADLSHFVGVIRVNGDGAEVVRKAKPIKHSIDTNEFWVTLMKVSSKRLGLKQNDLGEFFEAVEEMKRKLFWNQHIVGFDRKWMPGYIDFSEKEKAMVQAFKKAPDVEAQFPLSLKVEK